MPSAHAHTHGDEGDDAAELSLRDRPINLVDIARVLGASANVGRLGDARIRAWRDDLILIRESLGYALAVLAADVAILSQSSSPERTEPERVVDALPGVLAGSPPGDQWSEASDEADDLEFDEGLFIRTDHLLTVHLEMARVDLSSPLAVARVRALVEEQLALLTEREAAVEARLQQVRAVIIRRYRERAAPVRDQPA